MASKQLDCSLACSTQVVLEHETRCLNVKLLIFLALHKNTKYSLETQCGRSEYVPEGEGEGEGDGEGDGEGEGDGKAPINGECREIPRSNG